MSSNRSAEGLGQRSRWLLPALSVFVGGLVYSVLPRGAFGLHDIAARAVITAGTASLTSLLFLLVGRRRSQRASS
jgi:hypothetical protein